MRPGLGASCKGCDKTDQMDESRLVRHPACLAISLSSSPNFYDVYGPDVHLALLFWMMFIATTLERS